MFSFRHLPILGPKDTTANFEQLAGVITRLENEVTALRNVKVPVRSSEFLPAHVTKEAELPTVGNGLGRLGAVVETHEVFMCIKTTGTIAEQWKLIA